MKKKILVLMLSLNMALNVFSVAGAAEFEFTDGEFVENVETEEAMLEERAAEETEMFGEGDVVIEDKEAPIATEITPIEGDVKIGENVWVRFEDDNAIIFGTGGTWNYFEDGMDTTLTHANPFKGREFNKVTINNGITNLGDYLFAQTGIREIDISEDVTSIGKYTFYKSYGMRSIILPKTVTEIGVASFAQCSLESLIHKGVIEIIPEDAFLGCSSLQSFDFTGVKEIGSETFRGSNIIPIFTTSLERIGFSAFAEDYAITSVELPNSIIEVDFGAFRNCINLTRIILPNKKIGFNEVFSYCYSLQEIELPGEITYFSLSDCSGLQKVTVNGSETSVEFSTCRNLRTLTGYDCSYAKKYADENKIIFTSLGAGTHKWSTEKRVDKQPNCTEPGSKSNHCVICGEKRNEEEISALGHEWGNAVIIKEPTESEEGLKRYTCWRCNETKEETIPLAGQVGSIKVGGNVWATIDGNTLTLSGSGATYDYDEYDEYIPYWCEYEVKQGIENVIINEGITRIGNWFLAYARNIRDISFPSTLESIGEVAFLDCKLLKTLNLPETIQSIGSGAFGNCISLEIVDIPENIESLEGTFSGCSSLKEIHLSKGLKTIGNATFSCTSLQTMVIPDSVTEIGEQAFYGCDKLEDIFISKTVTYLAPDIFRNCRMVTIRGYKDSLVERYATANSIPFKSVDFKVVFKDGGRTIDEPQYIEAGKDAIPPILTPREGYTLSWDADYKDIQEDMIINAVWTKNDDGSSEPPIIIYPPEETKYIVTFKDRGKTIKTEKVKPGEAADMPYIERYGYELTWDKDFSDVTSNMTVNAIWTIIEPAKVNSLTVEIISKKISLSWDESEYAGYYKIYRKVSSDEKFTLVAKTSQILWNDRRAKTGVEYEYKVVAVRSVEGKLHESPDSDVVTVKLGEPEVGRIYTVGNLNYKVMNTSEVRVTGAAKSVASLAIPSAVSICGKSFKVTSIDHKAFYKNEDLIDVRMGKYITYVGQYSFYRCPNLGSVRFGKNVEVISTCAFTECPKLSNIVLPEKVKRLGAKVFYHCPNLKVLYIKTNYLEYIGKKGLAIDRKTIIKVPSRKYSVYKKMIEDSVKFAATRIVKL